MLHTLAILTGLWRAVLTLPGGDLPFTFEVKETNHKPLIEIINGEEKISVNEISIKGDSIFFKMPLYDSEFKALMTNEKMSGLYINHSRKSNAEIPFHAQYNIKERFFLHSAEKPARLEGKWAVHFSKGTPDSSFAVAIFMQSGNHLTGTFLTETGDYRYLDGAVDRDSLLLSCFDGSHAFLFKARLKNETLSGMYYSGNHWKEPWTAVRDENAELRDAYRVTTLKPGTESFNFSFPDVDSNLISFSDERFKNKVTVVQIMGSWCPNCMDETAFLSPFYKKYKDKNFQIIGLSFEKTNDFKSSVNKVKRVINHYNVEYPILIAGTTSKEDVTTALPMLNKLVGYPTTLIIDKKGNIRKIHTGFTGPATGKYYDHFVEEFTMMIEKLMAE